MALVQSLAVSCLQSANVRDFICALFQAPYIFLSQ